MFRPAIVRVGAPQEKTLQCIAGYHVDVDQRMNGDFSKTKQTQPEGFHECAGTGMNKTFQTGGTKALYALQSPGGRPHASMQRGWWAVKMQVAQMTLHQVVEFPAHTRGALGTARKPRVPLLIHKGYDFRPNLLREELVEDGGLGKSQEGRRSYTLV